MLSKICFCMVIIVVRSISFDHKTQRRTLCTIITSPPTTNITIFHQISRNGYCPPFTHHVFFFLHPSPFNFSLLDGQPRNVFYRYRLFAPRMTILLIITTTTLFIRRGGTRNRHTAAAEETKDFYCWMGHRDWIL